VLVSDALTSQFQQYADRWRSILGLTDNEVATQIRDDGIDVLVDLTLHMADNRLLVFARKPAPVQVTFAGYPGSTGLTTMDYRLSDPHLDPPGIDDSVYSEKTIRLPDTFWCYDPLDAGGIPVNPLPALDRNWVTFGCLNNFCKINDGVLNLWARVMHEVRDSRLLLLASHGSHRQWTLNRLGKEGIDPERIEFIAFQPRRAYLQTYNRIDLGLDSFPYNGHTTSLDSIWMGVPVVTLVGQTVASRAGWSQLSNLGLRELAGQTPDQFVQIAVELANDLPRLQGLRATLRQRMERSPLMDAPRFARNIEVAFRQMWHEWCATACAGS
jgi:predicted O-linked N-acetylglucosamine transferase (SPINDLY family)